MTAAQLINGTTNLRSLLSTTLSSMVGRSFEAVPALALSQLTLDSRAVLPGAVFVAVPGLRAHGIHYAAQAVERGAVAVLYEPADGAEETIRTLSSRCAMIEVPQLSRHLGRLANAWFACPSEQMRVAAVTGTNGKSTTAYLIADAASRCNLLTGYSGTVGCGLLSKLEATSHTTPDVIGVHRQLAAIRQAGAVAVGMEVSSHALHQRRIEAVSVDTAVFTNLTRDHLDYHGSMQAYGEAKARLFNHPGLRHAVINADDVFGRDLLSRPATAAIVTAYGCEPINHHPQALWANQLTLSAQGLSLELAGSFGTGILRSPLLGRFNAYNLLSTLCVLLGWEISLNAALEALAIAAAPPGRMETHRDRRGRLVVVDYAHTPDALEKVLVELKAYCRGKLTCVFGCGGNRDAGKRAQMGAIAERLADRVVLTDDNPRFEDPEQIIAGIRRGFKQPERAAVQHDRALAIAQAIMQANAGDIVLVAGKGHEDYQLLGETSTRFSDREVVLNCLQEAA